MKTHTSSYKNEIKLLGKQLDSIITYKLDDVTHTLGVTELNAVTPSYQGNLLKSVMKELVINSNIDIPLGTILKYQFGLKVNNEYEYLDFGNYIVYSSEKQEDTKSYNIICYDKMLYSMIPYEKLNITYPISVRDYINVICSKIGLTFKDVNTNFANYNKLIDKELYLDENGNDLGYTFRDVLSELAQVTASTICINENTDELEIRYINNTNDTIDEEYLKDVNVNFSQKYGPVNSIVLSRSAESDNVYLKDEESVVQNGLCEIKIIDNQIMNWNDRADYLADILAKLNGLEYYLNDYVSPGITYYDLCDKYNVKIGNITYPCIMLNDEMLVTQGLEENVYTDLLNESVTDYSKADKTDRRINQTYLIVNKQNQIIQGIVKTTDEHSEKIADLEINIDEISTRVDTVIDVDEEKETSKANLNFTNINNGTPIFIHMHPIDEEIGDNYPTPYKVPMPKLTPKSHSILRFHNITENEDTDYIIPTQLRVFNNVYDELYINYVKKKAYITRRIGVNENGWLYLLENELIEDIPLPSISLKNGDYKVSLLGYDNAYLRVSLMIQNIYTTQFPTKDFMGSLIKQLRDSILLEVREGYIDKDDILAQINLAIEEGKGIIKFLADTLLIDTDNFKLDEIGKLECIGAILKDVIINGGYINFTKNNDKYGYKTYVNYQQINLSDDFGRMIQFYIPDPDEFMTGYKQAFMKIHDDMGQINISTSDIETRSSVTNQNTRFNLLDGAMYLNEVHANNFVSTSNGYIPNSPDITKFTMIYSSKYYLEVTSMMGAFGLDAWLSDKRLKKDIADTKLNALDIIDKIKHREFKYKVGDSELIKIGYVADELQEIDEQMIFEVGEDKIKQPSQSYIIPLLSKGIQELHKKVVNQNKKIASLEERINKLESLIKGE